MRALGSLRLGFSTWLSLLALSAEAQAVAPWAPASVDTTTTATTATSAEEPPLSPEELALIEALTAPPASPPPPRPLRAIAPRSLLETSVVGSGRGLVLGIDGAQQALVLGARVGGGQPMWLDGLPLWGAELAAGLNPLPSWIAPERYGDPGLTLDGLRWSMRRPRPGSGTDAWLETSARTADRGLGAAGHVEVRGASWAASLDASHARTSPLLDPFSSGTSTAAPPKRDADPFARTGVGGSGELRLGATRLRAGGTYDRLDDEPTSRAAERGAGFVELVYDGEQAELRAHAGLQRLSGLGLRSPDAFARAGAGASDTWSASLSGDWTPAITEEWRLGPLVEAVALHSVSPRGTITDVGARAGLRLRAEQLDLRVSGGVVHVRSEAGPSAALGVDVVETAPALRARAELRLSPTTHLRLELDQRAYAPTLLERALGWRDRVDTRREAALALRQRWELVQLGAEVRCAQTSGATRLPTFAAYGLTYGATDAACGALLELGWSPTPWLRITATPQLWPLRDGIDPRFPIFAALGRLRVEPGLREIYAELRAQGTVDESSRAAATLALQGGLALGAGFEAELALENLLDARFTSPWTRVSAVGLELRAALRWRSFAQ